MDTSSAAAADSMAALSDSGMRTVSRAVSEPSSSEVGASEAPGSSPVDEHGVTTGELQVEASVGQLRGDLERHLTEQVEQLQLERGVSAEAMRWASCGRLVVAGDVLEGHPQRGTCGVRSTGAPSEPTGSA